MSKILKTCGVKNVEMWAATVETEVWAATVENLAKASKWKTVRALFSLQVVPKQCNMSRINFAELTTVASESEWLENESFIIDLLARKASPNCLAGFVTFGTFSNEIYRFYCVL